MERSNLSGIIKIEIGSEIIVYSSPCFMVKVGSGPNDIESRHLKLL